MNTPETNQGLVTSAAAVAVAPNKSWAAATVRYSFAIVVVLLTLFLRWALIPVIGPGTLYITLFPAMMILAVTVGTGPGLFGNALGIVLIEYFLVEPVGHLALSLSLVVRSSIMLMTTYYVGRVGDRLRTARESARQEAAALRSSEEASRLEITKRKRAEQALETERARLEFSLETIHIGAWDLDLTDHTAFRSLEHDRIFGYAELLPQWTYEMFLEHVLPEDRPAVDTKFRQAMAMRSDWSFECRITRKDGEVRWIWAAGRHQNDATGQPRRMAGIVQDITERHQADAALRESQRQNEFLAGLVRASSQPLGVGYPDGRLGLVNHAFEELTGYSADELRSLDWATILTPPEWREAERHQLAELHRTGQAVRYEKEYLRKDGSRVPIELLVHLATNAERQPQYYYSFITNITERKRTEERLRQTAAELQAANASLQESRQAALNLMDDALRARQRVETLNAELSAEVKERRQTEVHLHRLNRALRARSRSDQAMMRAQQESAYLNEVCQIVVQDCGYAMVWIGYAEHNAAKSIRPMAWAGFEEGYLETLKLTWADTERGRGPTGTAIRTGHPSMCRNMITDPQFAPWREQALKRGYASSLVLPLRAEAKVFGAITIYSREPDPFTPDEIELLNNLADDLAYGIDALRLRQAHQQAELALRQSEQRVRLKLESILSPEGDFGKLELADMIDATALQSMMEDFYAIAGIPLGIIDLNGKVLVRVGWQDICAQFHRVHPETCQYCVESDTLLSAGVQPGEFKLYKCKNHLWDVATPIFLSGKHLGNLFMGQFFFQDEPVNRELFCAQARKYGFVESDYLAALDRTPRLSREALDKGMTYMARLSEMLSKLGFSNIKLARTLAEQTRIEKHLRRTTTELQRSNRDLEQFAYVASHDLQEPLRAVASYVDLLGDRFANQLDEKARRYITHAKEGALRMHNLIQDLLAFSRVSSRVSPFVPVDLNVPLAEALRNLEVVIRNSGAQIVHEALPTLSVDASQIRQLFQNLLANAIKFCRTPPPQIRVWAQRLEPGWRIAVQDNGIGIDPRYFDRLFQIFQRLHTRVEYPGTGIGLAICKKIVERHNGRIWVESAPGHGSTFFFSLPDSHPEFLKPSHKEDGEV